MPRLTTDRVPKHRKHKASGQAVVTIGGADRYIGRYDSKASLVEYDRLVGEWLAAGRPRQAADTTPELSIAELLAAYWRHVQSYYVKGGRPTDEVGVRSRRRCGRSGSCIRTLWRSTSARWRSRRSATK